MHLWNCAYRVEFIGSLIKAHISIPFHSSWDEDIFALGTHPMLKYVAWYGCLDMATGQWVIQLQPMEILLLKYTLEAILKKLVFYHGKCFPLLRTNQQWWCGSPNPLPLFWVTIHIMVQMVYAFMFPGTAIIHQVLHCKCTWKGTVHEHLVVFSNWPRKIQSHGVMLLA